MDALHFAQKKVYLKKTAYPRKAITGQIPETLLYEEFGGRKYYRRGYRQVLLGLLSATASL